MVAVHVGQETNTLMHGRRKVNLI